MDRAEGTDCTWSGAHLVVSLMAVNNRKAADGIRARLLQHGIQAHLQVDDPAGLALPPSGHRLIHIVVAETDLARAREILAARLEDA